MKLKLFIFVLFILPSIIYSRSPPRYHIDLLTKLDEFASREETSTINGALKLEEDGFLGDGYDGLVYEGTIINDEKFTGRHVAIKFVNNTHTEERGKEIKMYHYLEAYRNETVEKYGIPALYYYGRWEEYILIALTKFDEDLSAVAEDVRSGSIELNDLDVLILCRDFVFQTKYIHSHGVRHDGIRPSNIMIRGHRCFLIDFAESSKMAERCLEYISTYASKRVSMGAQPYAIDDYESFLYTISDVMHKDWFSPWNDNKETKKRLGNSSLEKIIKAFADEVWPNNGNSRNFPDYDHFETIISMEMTAFISPKFSWKINDAETSAAYCPARDITKIDNPFDFTEFVYPELPEDLNNY